MPSLPDPASSPIPEMELSKLSMVRLWRKWAALNAVDFTQERGRPDYRTQYNQGAAGRFTPGRYYERGDRRPKNGFLLVRIAPRIPRRRISFRRGLVHGIGPTVPSNPSHGGQALLKCCKPAIGGTAMMEIVIGAPPTVLRLSGLFEADDSRKNSQGE
jgi:hypothetical protein